MLIPLECPGAAVMENGRAGLWVGFGDGPMRAGPEFEPAACRRNFAHAAGEHAEPMKSGRGRFVLTRKTSGWAPGRAPLGVAGSVREPMRQPPDWPFVESAGIRRTPEASPLRSTHQPPRSPALRESAAHSAALRSWGCPANAFPGKDEPWS